MARSFLFVAHDSSPFLSFYDDLMRKGLNTNITGGNPPGVSYGCAFSPDGSRLAVAHHSSPFLTVYNTSNWSKVALIGDNPPGVGYGCAFNHDGSRLAVAHNSSPFLTVYNTSDWSKVALIGGNPPSAGYGCAFNHDGSRLAVAHHSRPFLTVYNTSDWSKVALTGGNPPGIGQGCAFSPLIGGTISNEDTTPITDALNVPVVRRVMALRRSDMAILAEAMSGSDGYYDIALLDNSEPVTVLFQADNNMENSVVADWVEAT